MVLVVKISTIKKKITVILDQSRHLFKFVEFRVWFIFAFISSSLMLRRLDQHFIISVKGKQGPRKEKNRPIEQRKPARLTPTGVKKEEESCNIKSEKETFNQQSVNSS